MRIRGTTKPGIWPWWQPEPTGNIMPGAGGGYQCGAGGCEHPGEGRKEQEEGGV